MNLVNTATPNVSSAASNARLMIRGATAAFAVLSLGTGLAFGVQVFLARSLEKGNYGEYVYALTLTNLLAMFVRLGLDTATLRFVPMYQGRAEWGLLRGFLRTSRQIVLATSVFASLAMGLVVWFIRDRIATGLADAVLLACLLLPLLVLQTIHGAGLRAFKRVILSRAPLQIVRPLLLVAGVILSTRVLRLAKTAPTAMTANIVATLSVLLLSVAFLHRTLPRQLRAARPQYRSKEWLWTALPMLLVSGFSLVLTRTAILMVGAFIGTADAGIYAVASRVAMLIAFGLTSVNVIVAPMISQLHAQERTKELQRMLTLAARGILAITIPLALGMIVWGSPVLGLFGAAFTEGYTALVILAIGQLINALGGSVGFLMIMTGHHKQMACVMGGSAVLSVALNAILIPTFGIAGGGVATALTTAMSKVAMILYVRKKIGMDTTVFALLSRGA